MDQSRSWKLSIIGARLTGPDPISSVWVPREPGVEALYGLNGAGKTRLLWSLADLYAGEGGGYLVAEAVSSDEVKMVIELDTDSEPPTWTVSDGRFSITDCFESSPGGEAELRWMSLTDGAPWKAADRLEWHDVMGDLLWAQFSRAHIVTPSIGKSVLTAQVDDVVRQGLFGIYPTTEGWKLTPALLIDATTPVLQADRLRLVSARDRYLLREHLHGMPFEADPESLGDDEAGRNLQAVLEDATQVGIDFGDSLLTTFTPLFEAIRDLDAELFVSEVNLLDEAPLVPYLLGGGDVGLALGDLDGPVAHVIRNDDQSASRSNRQTCEVLAAVHLDSDDDSMPDGIIGSSLRRVSNYLSRTASYIYSTLLVDAPKLYVDLKEPAEWFFGPPAEWMAVDLAGATIALEQLSEAQLRWALVAISLALPTSGIKLGDEDPVFEDLEPGPSWLESRPIVVALDEPDAALHVTAQRHALAGIVGLAGQPETTVVCSTHSREFLNADDVRLHHVFRDSGGKVVLSRLDTPQRSQIHELGLAPADLFMLHRAILVVEGTHDEIVINGLIGDELRQAHVLVIPMRGARNLASIVDAHVFAEFSDAPVIAALDNIRATQLAKFWADLVARQHQGQEAFDEVVLDHFKGARRTEETFLINYCRAIAAQGLFERFQLFGFAKADIPEYLPVEMFVPDAQSWAALRSEFEAQKNKGKGIHSFKPWLLNAHGVDITPDVLKRAIAVMDTVPQEFVDLARLCSEVRHGPRSVNR